MSADEVFAAPLFDDSTRIGRWDGLHEFILNAAAFAFGGQQLAIRTSDRILEWLNAICQLLLLKCRAQKRQKLPAVHVFVRRFAGRIVSAGKHHGFVVQAVPLEFVHYLPRKLRKKRQIILRINDQRLLRPAGILLEIRHIHASQRALTHFPSDQT